MPILTKTQEKLIRQLARISKKLRRGCPHYCHVRKKCCLTCSNFDINSLNCKADRWVGKEGPCSQLWNFIIGKSIDAKSINAKSIDVCPLMNYIQRNKKRYDIRKLILTHITLKI